VTKRSGLGKAGGTIAIRSRRRFPPCADAVNRNILAKARRGDTSQSNRVGRPRLPSKKKGPNDAVKTLKGTITKLFHSLDWDSQLSCITLWRCSFMITISQQEAGVLNEVAAKFVFGKRMSMWAECTPC